MARPSALLRLRDEQQSLQDERRQDTTVTGEQ